VSGPHDALFKRVFSNLENAEGLMRVALPTEIANRVDWSSLSLESGSVVDETLKSVHADLIFSVQLDAKPALIYLLLEHQSTSHRFMALRMLLYVGRVWERWLDDHPGASLLPPIVPLVVHHDRKRWSAATVLSELVDVDAAAWPALAALVPNLRFLVDDLSHAEDADLTARSRTAFAELGLRMLQRARLSRDFLVEMTSWRGAFRRVSAAPNGVAALAALLEYALRVTEVPAEDLRRFAHQLGPTGDEAFMTGAQQLIETGRLAGQAEGRAELLINQLTTKFGAVPEGTMRRIRTASIEELDRFGERVLSAQSLDQVFG
jgi:hypothetical protein